MKKLLLILLPLILFLVSCGGDKGDLQPVTQSLEETLVGHKWCLSNADEDGFSLTESGSFFTTKKCVSNDTLGIWILDSNLINYSYIDNSIQTTVLWGEISEYSTNEVKILINNTDTSTSEAIYSLTPEDVYGCMDPEQSNYNPLANCPNSCTYNVQSTNNYLDAELIFIDVGRIIREGLIYTPNIKSCPNYNLMNADTSDIDTLIIDFGSTNCLYSGYLRRGRINITYTGNYHDSYSVITSAFDNYYVNNLLVQGERVVTNQGINSNGNMWFTIDINNASITTLHSITNWNSNRVIEWVNGENTLYNIYDDVYKITGSANGNVETQPAFSIQITNPLEVDYSCYNSTDCIIKSGEAILSSSGYSDRIINYGNLICDCDVDVIINGNVIPFFMGL